MMRERIQHPVKCEQGKKDSTIKMCVPLPGYSSPSNISFNICS